MTYITDRSVCMALCPTVQTKTMSLFTTQDVAEPISVVGAQNSAELCNCSLLVASLTNSLNPEIIVGTSEGILGVHSYLPSDDSNESGTFSQQLKFEALLETRLSLPIVELKIGRVAMGKHAQFLVVLHPRKLTVFDLVVNEALCESGREAKLVPIYEHILPRQSCQLIIGPFGQLVDKDILCVQSLDGILTFFEQERPGFSVMLPNFFLPGQLCYCERTDSFITLNYSLAIECYRYQTLGAAADMEERAQISRKKLNPDWTYAIGENIVDLQCVRFKESCSLFVVLGTKYLYCLRDIGTLKFMKKLDYDSACCCAYPSNNGSDSVIILVCTHTSTLLVYEDATLRWNCQLPYIPLSICRLNLRIMAGLLVLLSNTGEVRVSYLGTQLMQYVAPVPRRNFDYEAAEKELTKLNKLIRQSKVTTPRGVKGNKEAAILEASLIFDHHVETQEVPGNHYSQYLIRAMLTLATKSVAHDVYVNLHCVSPIQVSKPSYHFPIIDKVVDVSVHFFVGNLQWIVSDLAVQLTCVYIDSKSKPGTLQIQAQIPPTLVLSIAQPERDADFKVTLTTSKPTVPLGLLFPEFETDFNNANALALAFENGALVTVLASKSSERYRIQSNHFPALTLVTGLLVSALRNMFDKDQNFEVHYDMPLPLDEVFRYLENYSSSKLSLAETKTDLANQSLLYRAMQRRLLTKYQERNPSTFDGLDKVFSLVQEKTLKQILHAEEAQETLRASSNDLACCLRLLVLLVSLTSSVNTEDAKILEDVLSPMDLDNSSDEQSWEQVAELRLTHYLKQKLSASVTSQSGLVLPGEKGVAVDMTRLKKRIIQTIDASRKGTKLKGSRKPAENEPIPEEES